MIISWHRGSNQNQNVGRVVRSQFRASFSKSEFTNAFQLVMHDSPVSIACEGWFFSLSQNTSGYFIGEQPKPVKQPKKPRNHVSTFNETNSKIFLSLAGFNFKLGATP